MRLTSTSKMDRLVRIAILLFLPLASSSCLLDTVQGAIPRPPPGQVDWAGPLVSRNAPESGGVFALKWVRDSVFSRQDTGVIVSAAAGRLAIVGSESDRQGEGLLMLEGSSGVTLWRVDTGYQSAIMNTKEMLYAGSPGNVVAHDPATGDLLWSTHLPWSRSPRSLYLASEELDVNTSHQVFHILDRETGRLLETWNYGADMEVFLREDAVIYRQGRTLNSLQAVASLSQGVLWASLVPEAYYMGPVFTTDLIILRTGRDSGTVLALDRRQGTLLWGWSEVPVVSNVAVFEDRVFFLTSDARLMLLDIASGLEVSSVSFGGPDFALIDEDLHQIGYQVAADNESQGVYALLGDSRQLFAFLVTN